MFHGYCHTLRVESFFQRQLWKKDHMKACGTNFVDKEQPQLIIDFPSKKSPPPLIEKFPHRSQKYAEKFKIPMGAFTI